MNDQLIRIGKGPQGPRVKRPIHYWMVAAAVLIAVSAMIVSTIVWGPKTAQPAASAPTNVANEVECTTIKREYELWINSYNDLTRLINARSVEAEHYADRIKESTESLLKASQGYDDIYSKELARAAAQLQLDLGRLRMYLGVTGSFEPEMYDATAASWHALRPVYDQFEKYQC